MYDITVYSYRDSYPIVSGRGFKFFYKKGPAQDLAPIKKGGWVSPQKPVGFVDKG